MQHVQTHLEVLIVPVNRDSLETDSFAQVSYAVDTIDNNYV
jgi:hypothetical protein